VRAWPRLPYNGTGRPRRRSGVARFYAEIQAIWFRRLDRRHRRGAGRLAWGRTYVAANL